MAVSLPAARLPSAAALQRPALAETCVAAALLVLCAGAGLQFLTFYRTALLPHRPAVSTPAPTFGVPLSDREAVERFQRVRHLLGEASAYRLAHREDWAEEALAAALALDPTHPEALAMRAHWDATPLPTPSPEQTAALARQERVTELLGATIALLDAHETPTAALAEARSYLDEALSLDPAHPTTLTLLERLARPPS